MVKSKMNKQFWLNIFFTLLGRTEFLAIVYEFSGTHLTSLRHLRVKNKRIGIKDKEKTN